MAVQLTDAYLATFGDHPLLPALRRQRAHIGELKELVASQEKVIQDMQRGHDRMKRELAELRSRTSVKTGRA